MRTNKILAIIIILAGFCLNLFSNQNYDVNESFVINIYDISVDVQENNSYVVTETIDLTFLYPRRGIIRDIPLKYKNYPVKISDISVEGHKSEIDYNFKDLSIKIGEKGKDLSERQVYKIKYILDVGDDRNDKMDEFYLNLIGNQWDTYIATANFEINMPFPFDDSKVNFTSGNLGSTDNTNVAWQVVGTKILGSIRNPLQNMQGLTIALPLPEGYWRNTKRHFLVTDIKFYIIYLLIPIFIFILWLFKGRNKRIFPSAEFYPPNNISSADVGYIFDGVTDNIDITSLIIGLADKGFMTIEEKDEVITFHKSKEIDDSISSNEQYLLKKIFAEKEDVSISDLRGNFHAVIDNLCWSVLLKYSKYNPKISTMFSQDIKTGSATLDTFANSFVKKDPDVELLKVAENDTIPIFDKPSFKFHFFTKLFAIIPLIFLFYKAFMAIPYGAIGGLNVSPIVLGMIILPFVFLLLYYFSYIIFVPNRSKKSLLALIAAFLGLALLFYITAGKHAGVSIIHYVASSISTFFSFGFLHLFSLKRTPAGLKLYEKILGFRKFIEAAEKDKINKLFESNPSYFYNILPFALVMGLTDKWASHFSNLAIQPPQWYAGHRKDLFRVDKFARDMENDISKMNSYLSYNPSAASSSSSGGNSSSSGGSSGGGAGGGGGRSW